MDQPENDAVAKAKKQGATPKKPLASPKSEKIKMAKGTQLKSSAPLEGIEYSSYRKLAKSFDESMNLNNVNGMNSAEKRSRVTMTTSSTQTTGRVIDAECDTLFKTIVAKQTTASWQCRICLVRNALTSGKCNCCGAYDTNNSVFVFSKQFNTAVSVNSPTKVSREISAQQIQTWDNTSAQITAKAIHGSPLQAINHVFNPAQLKLDFMPSSNSVLKPKLNAASVDNSSCAVAQKSIKTENALCSKTIGASEFAFGIKVPPKVAFKFKFRAAPIPGTLLTVSDFLKEEDAQNVAIIMPRNSPQRMQQE